jgi:hypothetical protein
MQHCEEAFDSRCRSRRRFQVKDWPLAIALCCAHTVGCADQLPARHPVNGQVLQAHKPLAEAMVVLHPKEGSFAAAQKPIAYTDAAGRFNMTTFQQGDGAPAGQYWITVELRAPRQAGEEVVRDGRNMLPPRYAMPNTSGLQVDVKVGANEIPPIDLPLK